MKRRPSYYVAFSKRHLDRAKEAKDNGFLVSSVLDVVTDYDEYINELVAEVRRLREKCGEDPDSR